MAWASAVVAWYDGTTRAVELTSQTAVWYRSGKPPVLIRWVLVRDPQGEFTPQALLCTDPSADPTQILEWFVLRWQLEVTFQKVRAHLGVETQRQWSGPGHCPYYANPDGALLLDHPGSPAAAATTTLGPSHSGLVRQAVADLRGCHRSGAPPPVAGVGGFFTVRRRPRYTESPGRSVPPTRRFPCLRRLKCVKSSPGRRALLPHATGRAAWSETIPGFSPLGVGLTSGDTMAVRADWASLMVCSSATGSNVVRRSLSFDLASALTASCRIILTTNKGLDEWGDPLGDMVIASVIWGY